LTTEGNENKRKKSKVAVMRRKQTFRFDRGERRRVVQLTRAFANEWAAKGINANAIAPGYMATDNTTALRNDPSRNRAILERIPAGRWGQPADLAGAAIFLCSPASDFVHGHVLVVDGGWLSR
jgi:2-deoxy-D-gluconate 3-dehydrogenase